MKRILLLILVFTLALGVLAWANGASPKGSKATTAKADTTDVTGWISDDKCGAKGANAKGEACTKKCIEGGAKAVLVNDADGKVLAIDNADAVKGHEGHHVTVTGHVDSAKGSIHVASLKMAAAAPKS
jgi:hypothetical protein